MATNLEELTWQTGQVLLSLGIVVALGVALARFLPSLPGFDTMVLSPPGAVPNEPRLRMETSPSMSGLNPVAMPGEKGIALTMLRPSGKARFDDRVIDVISEGPFISADTELEVIATNGNKIIVRQV